MFKRYQLPALTLALTLYLPSGAHAADCSSVDASGEFEGLSLGDEVYAGLLSKVTMTIKSIDREARKICGEISGKDKCFSAERVYSEDGKAACVQAAKDAGPMDAGFIFLYEDEDEDNDADE